MTEQSTSASGAGYDPHTSPAPSVPEKRASYWEDFIDIFYAPSQVFRRREHSGFGVPMLVITLLITVIGVATSGAMQSVIDGEFARASAKALQQNPNLPPDALAKMRGFTEFFAKWGAVVLVPVAMFLTGLCLWVIGKLLDAKQTLAAAIMVTAYAFTPRVLQSLLNAVQGLLLDASTLNGFNRLSLGPARFFDPDTTSPLAIALLMRLDLITIWATVLLAIGLAVTGKISRRKAAIGAAAVWLLATLPALMSARR